MAESPYFSPPTETLNPTPPQTALDSSNSGDSPDSFSIYHDSTNTPAPETLPLSPDQAMRYSSIDNASYFSCITDIQTKLDVSAHSTDLDISTQSSDLNLSTQSDPSDRTTQPEEDMSLRVSTSTPVKVQDRTLITDPSLEFGDFADAVDSPMLDPSPHFGVLSAQSKSRDEEDHTDTFVSSGTDHVESSDDSLWTTAPQNMSNQPDEGLIGAQSSGAILSNESSEVFVLTDPNQSTHMISISESKSDNIDPTKSSSSSILVLGKSHRDCRRSQSLDYSDGDAPVEEGEDVFEKNNNISRTESLKIHQVQSVSSSDLINPDQDIAPDPKSGKNIEEPKPDFTQNNSALDSSDVDDEISPHSSDETDMGISVCNTVIFNVKSLQSDQSTVADPGGVVLSDDAPSPKGMVEVISSSIEVLTSPSTDLRKEDSLEISELTVESVESEVPVIDDLPNSTEVAAASVLEPTEVPVEKHDHETVNEEVTATNTDDQMKVVLDEVVQIVESSSSAIIPEEAVNYTNFRDEITENIIQNTDDIDEIDDEIMELSRPMPKPSKISMTSVTSAPSKVKIDEIEIESLKTISPEEYISSQESSPVNNRPCFEESCESGTVGSGHTTPRPRIRTPSMQSVNSQPNHYTNRTTEYPATDALFYRIQNLLRQEDVDTITNKQKTMLNKLECTNQKLMSFNELSEVELEKAQLNFRHYTKLLIDMRKDVETAFKRISSIKSKLSIQYPEAWAAMSVHTCTDYIDPDEEEHEICFKDRLPVPNKDPDQASHDSFVVVGSYSSSTRDDRLGSVDEDPAEGTKSEIDNTDLEDSTLEATTHHGKITEFPHSPLVDKEGVEEEGVIHYELHDNSIDIVELHK